MDTALRLDVGCDMSLLKVVGVALSLIVIAASAWMNFEYMYGEGLGRAALVLGVMSVAFDLIKALLPIVIAAALAERAWLRAGVASFFLVPLVAFGFVSALGFGESNKGNRVTTREALAAELRDADRDLDAARSRLKELGSSRPAAVIVAELAGLKKDRLWDSSKGCKEPTIPASREMCKTVERLNGEAATAAEVQLLTQKIDRLGNEVQRLRSRGAGGDADPQASAIRRIVGHLLPQSVDAAVIRSGVVWLFAVLVEGWSAFGLFICGVRHWERKRTSTADLHGDDNTEKKLEVAWEERTAPPVAEPISIVEDERVLRAAAWALARLDFTDSSGLMSFEEAFDDYVSVAAQYGKTCLPQREFRRALIGIVVELDCEVWGNEFRQVRLGHAPHLEIEAVPMDSEKPLQVATAIAEPESVTSGFG